MAYIRLEQDDDGVVELIIDQPDSKVNVMGEAYDAAMREAVADLVERKDAISGVYVRSGKAGHFFAGGDIKAMMEMDLNPSAEEKRRMFEGMLASKQPLRQLETLGVPVAVGINGAALGGGYEICLACHHRVALDAPTVQIGLPEAQLGLMPGAGGVVRLTRLLGIQAALPLISKGSRLKAEKALQQGLVDELAADEEDMARRAKEWIKANPKFKQPWDRDDYRMPGGAPSSPKMQQALYFGPVMVLNETQGNMPAQKVIFAAICDTARVDVDTAFKVESRYFMRLLLDQTARNMMRAFFVQMNAVGGGASRPQGVKPTQVKRLAVLGAGLMGAGIAFNAARSGIDVALKDRDRASAEKGREYTEKACAKSKRIDEAKAAEILARVQVVDEMEDFADCDALIEAVFEDRALKAEVSAEALRHLPKTAFFATNTSALPIGELAEAAGDAADRFVGMHFFSPAERMPLVEIIRGEKTSDEAVARAFDLARQLGKTPIVVNDAPGFFTTRVIGKMVGQGLDMLTEGADAVTLENAARQAGCPVGPLALSDEIGLGTAHHAQTQAFKDAEARGEKIEPTPANELLRVMVEERKRRGKGDGGGFYEYPEGQDKHIWGELRGMFKAVDMPVADIKDRLLYAEALEAVRAMEQGVIDSVADANIGSIMGIGFPPHTGGVLQFINACGLEAFVARADDLHQRYGHADFEVPAMLRERAASGELFL